MNGGIGVTLWCDYGEYGEKWVDSRSPLQVELLLIG